MDGPAPVLFCAGHGYRAHPVMPHWYELEYVTFIRIHEICSDLLISHVREAQNRFPLLSNMLSLIDFACSRSSKPVPTFEQHALVAEYAGMRRSHSHIMLHAGQSGAHRINRQTFIHCKQCVRNGPCGKSPWKNNCIMSHFDNLRICTAAHCIRLTKVNTGLVAQIRQNANIFAICKKTFSGKVNYHPVCEQCHLRHCDKPTLGKRSRKDGLQNAMA